MIFVACLASNLGIPYMGRIVCLLSATAHTPSPTSLSSLIYIQGTNPFAFGLQVHDQRSAMTEEEEAANQVWLDGGTPPQQNMGLESQARHMIQNQRQYYDEVHVIKEQVRQLSVTVPFFAALFVGLKG